MEKKSWVFTLLIQLCLCLAVYLALDMGYQRTDGRKPAHFYFLSVKGGFRPLNEQTLLLKQIEKAVKTYKANFVINISELGHDDPLEQNATWYLEQIQVPWYTTRALKQGGTSYFVKKFKIPGGTTLEVIALDTGAFEDPSSGFGSNQLNWLTRTLRASISNWRIVVGYDSLMSCAKNVEQMEVKLKFENMHRMLLNYGVNAYLSGQDCAYNGPGDSAAVAANRGPYLNSLDQILVLNRKTVNGFLVHRVSSLEIVTYFVTLKGEIVQRIALCQKGKDAL